MISGYSLIEGKWQEGDGDSFSSVNPATQKVIWSGRSCTKDLISKSLKSLRKTHPSWAASPLDERIQIVTSYKTLLEKEKNNLAEIISIETGKALWETQLEVKGMINKIDISIDAYNERCKTILKTFPQKTSITHHKPHGILAILGPFNFPAHLPHGHIVPALIAGNSIIFKPSEHTPKTAEFIINLWLKTNLPKGVISLIQGHSETGKSLSTHPGIDGVLFTGSSTTGHAIASQLAKTPHKICALEMGGNNPLVIGSVADLDTIIPLIIQSAYMTTGQRCTCARRLILSDPSQKQPLIKKITKMIDRIRIGPYTQSPEPFCGPVISTESADQLIAAQEQLIQNGANIIVPMIKQKNSAFISPGLIDCSAIEHPKDFEIFGPLLQLIETKNLKDAITVANTTNYGLSASLCSDKKTEYQQFYQSIQAGVINWNNPTNGAYGGAPFGGIKHSGNHRPSAYYAADYCAYPVATTQSDSPASIKLPGLT